MKSNKEIQRKAGVKSSKMRNDWIPQTWRYNGAGIRKSKKYEIYRKRKHKKSPDNDNWQTGDFYFA